MTTILSERLQAAMDSAARLPRERQDELAARIEEPLDELDSAAWDAAFVEPGSADFFAELAADVESGPTRPFPSRPRGARRMRQPSRSLTARPAYRRSMKPRTPRVASAHIANWLARWVIGEAS